MNKLSFKDLVYSTDEFNLIIENAHYTNIERDSLENDYFREVLFTTANMQLVVMSLEPNENIGMEVHEDIDQFIRIEKGKGIAVIDGKEYPLYDGVSVIVPKGSQHDIINTSPVSSMKLYTVYAPPKHAVGTIHYTKKDAAEEE